MDGINRSARRGQKYGRMPAFLQTPLNSPQLHICAKHCQQHLFSFMLLCVLLYYRAGLRLPILMCRRSFISKCSWQMAWVTSAQLVAQLLYMCCRQSEKRLIRGAWHTSGACSSLASAERPSCSASRSASPQMQGPGHDDKWIGAHHDRPAWHELPWPCLTEQSLRSDDNDSSGLLNIDIHSSIGISTCYRLSHH